MRSAVDITGWSSTMSTLAGRAWVGARFSEVRDDSAGECSSVFSSATTARHQSRADMQAMQRHHEDSVTAERQSIARDLHDMVAHDITIIAMQSRAAQLDGSDCALKDALDIIGQSSRAALQDLRRMLALLQDDESGHWESARSAAASELDLREGCRAFAQRLTSLGFTVDTSISGDLSTVSRSVSAALYRILQECTTNVVKYAGDGAQCWIEVEVGPECGTVPLRSAVPQKPVCTREPGGCGWGI